MRLAPDADVAGGARPASLRNACSSWVARATCSRLNPPVGDRRCAASCLLPRLSVRSPRGRPFRRWNWRAASAFLPFRSRFLSFRSFGWLQSRDRVAVAAAVLRGGHQAGRASVRRACPPRAHCLHSGAEWDAWVGEVVARRSIGLVPRWTNGLCADQGGRDMWSIRAERLFSDPSEHSATLGWVAPEDVLRWTGRVRQNERERKYRTWYEVELDQGRQAPPRMVQSESVGRVRRSHGSDGSVCRGESPAGVRLTRPRLRIAGRSRDRGFAAGRSGRRAVHRCASGARLGTASPQSLRRVLCGRAWLPPMSYRCCSSGWRLSARPREILAEDHGTSIPDLQSMLDRSGLKYEFYRSVGSTSPVTPNYVRRKLDAGMMAIVVHRCHAAMAPSSRAARSGTGSSLKTSSASPAAVGCVSTTRSPIARKTYRFDEVYDLPSRDSIGLWVEPLPAWFSESRAAVSLARPD